MERADKTLTTVFRSVNSRQDEELGGSRSGIKINWEEKKKKRTAVKKKNMKGNKRKRKTTGRNG